MHYTKAHLAASAMAGFLLMPAVAQACPIQFEQTAQSVSLSASQVGPGMEARHNFVIRLRTSDNKTTENDGSQCGVSIRFSQLPTTIPSGQNKAVLTTNGAIVDVLPTEISAPSTASDIPVAGQLGVTQASQGVPFQLVMPTEWGIASGINSDSLLVQLVDTNGNVIDTLTLSINISVLPSVELRLVGATGSDRIARVELGVLDPGRITRSDPFGVQVWSTGAYSVTIVSANAGNLAHATSSDQISYDLSLDGSRVNTAGALPATFGQRTGPLGQLHSVEITIMPFVALAGDYSDRVTVTVNAL